MNDAPSNRVLDYLVGWILALALGAFFPAAVAGAGLLGGRPLNLAEEGAVLLFQMLWTAIPFLLLALLGVRERLPWLVGLIPTTLLWLLLLVPTDGANIGLGLLLMIAPIPLSIAVIVAASRSEWRRG
jgi:hypothetical protein